MLTLLQLAATNAVAVIPLSVVVFLLTRVVRNAAVKHTLWVVVLVKFIAPPIVSLPFAIEWPSAATWTAARPATMFDRASSSATESGSNLLPDAVASPEAVAPSSDTTSAVSVVPAQTSLLAAVTRRLVVVGVVLGRLWQSHPALQTGLVVLWLVGSLGWAARQMWRAVRFERLLATAPSIPTRLQQQTDALAADLGLKHSPQVCVIDAAVSPMLWGCGRKARLLFPADLALRLDDEARATLITHELAHYSRGDHLVRVLEMFATAAFWWHPVLWWTRSQIEQAEEECCDAWVVRQFPHVPRRYAEALLDTIDFLCETQRALPPLASGLGQAPFLRRRLIQIMQGPRLQPVPPRVRMAILLTAAAILPLQPFVFATPSLSTARLPAATPVVILTESADAEPEVVESQTPESSQPRDRIGPTAPPPPRQLSPRVRGERQETIWSTAVSPDGRFVVQITTARRVRLTDLPRNVSVDLSNQNITAVAFAPDEPWFATAGSDGRVAIWDSHTGRALRVLDDLLVGLRSLAIAPDGRSLAVGGVDGSVVLYDLPTGRHTLSLPRATAAVNCVRYSPNGRQLAVAAGDWVSGSRGRVSVYGLDNGRVQAFLACATTPGAIAFASDEELIVGLFDGHVQLWNLATRQVVADSWTDKAVVATAAFSPDNPALREITFAPVETTAGENSPLDFLRSLLASPPAN
jgi:bla regulator protein BlaR1